MGACARSANGRCWTYPLVWLAYSGPRSEQLEAVEAAGTVAAPC